MRPEQLARFGIQTMDNAAEIRREHDSVLNCHASSAAVHRFAHAGHYLFEDEAESIEQLVQGFLAAEPAIRESVG